MHTNNALDVGLRHFYMFSKLASLTNIPIRSTVNDVIFLLVWPPTETSPFYISPTLSMSSYMEKEHSLGSMKKQD